MFDYDDAVLFRDSYDRRGPYSARRERRFAKVVQLADTVIAGNDFLADCALRAGAAVERVTTIPTCVNPELYPEIHQSHRQASDAHVDLVWIGSASTLQGLQQRQPLWDRLGREIPGLRLRVICDRFPRLDHLPVVPIPWAEAWEARDLSSGQIGVSWLPDDPWSRGKCGLKVLQYQAARLPVIANPVGMQTEMVKPGLTGFLADSADQWVEAVRRLANDERLRLAMGQTARQHVETSYSVRAWTSTFIAAVTGAQKPIANARADDRMRGSGENRTPEPFFLRLRRLGAGQHQFTPPILTEPASKIDPTRPFS